MLVTFTTKAHADILMFGDVAQAMLTMMGHSTHVPGAILAADVPAALSRLSTAIAIHAASSATPQQDEVTVSMAKRGGPLIELLTVAVRDESNVMWR
jgi:Domain of unknown function (DUF1840)